MGSNFKCCFSFKGKKFFKNDYIMSSQCASIKSEDDFDRTIGILWCKFCFCRDRFSINHNFLLGCFVHQCADQFVWSIRNQILVGYGVNDGYFFRSNGFLIPIRFVLRSSSNSREVDRLFMVFYIGVNSNLFFLIR